MGRQTVSYAEGAIRIDFDALCRLSCKGTIVIISQEVEGEICEMLLGAGITNYYGHVE